MGKKEILKFLDTFIINDNQRNEKNQNAKEKILEFPGIFREFTTRVFN